MKITRYRPVAAASSSGGAGGGGGGGGGGGTVGGDLSGSGSAPEVVGIRGNPIAADTPATSDVLAWDGTQWAPAGAGGSSPLTTKGDLYGHSTVDARVPVGSNGQVLTADSTDAEGVSWQTPAASSVGAELDYVQFTSPVTVSATTEGTATTIVTANAVSTDGTMKILIHFYCPYITPGSSAGASVIVQVNEGSTVLGYVSSTLVPSAAQMNIPENGFLRLTPSNASHTYSIRAFRGTANGTVGAGAGGAGAYQPGFIRITRIT